MGSASVVAVENKSDKLFITSILLNDACSLVSYLRLGDLNYLLSVKPTLGNQVKIYLAHPIMSVYPTNFLFTQSPIVNQDLPTLGQAEPTPAKLDHA